jgi:uncharacterized peroxidase-related enzyme
MPHVPPCLPPSASAEAQAIYDEFYRSMGFPAPPNFIVTQGHAPNVARGSWEAVRNILAEEGEIARWIKELMFVAISVDRGCVYCSAAHLACCRMLNVNPEWTEAAVQGDLDAIADAKLREMLQFALKAARDPRSLGPPDFRRLQSRGLRWPEIMEIIGMAAFAVYANIIADATAMESDPMFGELSQPGRTKV